MARYDLGNVITHLDEVNNRRIFSTQLDPVIEKDLSDIYVRTVIGDRLDLLAYQYYSDVSLYWIITAANPELRKDSLILEPGTQLRIPADPQKVIKSYIQLNASR
jgi:phage tail protein X